MNHIYRLIFNHTLGVMQAAPETAKGRGKRSASRSRAAAVGTFLTLALASGPALADGGKLTQKTAELRWVITPIICVCSIVLIKSICLTLPA